MFRDIENKLTNFYSNHPKKAVMILGARQVGKSYTIQKFAATHYKHYVLIDFVEDETNIALIKNAKSADEIMLRISAKFGNKLIPNETIIIFDEVQVIPQLIKFIKYLVQDYPYDFIITGSLLGAILNDVESVPVGYIDIWRMNPMSFREFMIANGAAQESFNHVLQCLQSSAPIDEYIHQQFLEQFHKYLIVGGMPEAVVSYTQTHNLNRVRNVQNAILKTYKADISKYNKNNKLYLNEIFDLVPSELNCKNKRFILKTLNKYARYSTYENAFYWLKNAGVVLPAFMCSQASIPLKSSKKNELFKLFMNDVGLLTCSYGPDAQLKILAEDSNFNCGAIYENAMAQMLSITEDELYYYQNKKNGEVDFIAESAGGIMAIEVKSGKDYKRHSALNNLIKTGQCKQAVVACNSNIKKTANVLYLPIYIFGFIAENKTQDTNIQF